MDVGALCGRFFCRPPDSLFPPTSSVLARVSPEFLLLTGFEMLCVPGIPSAAKSPRETAALSANNPRRQGGLQYILNF
jgi:hypothetical protein